MHYYQPRIHLLRAEEHFDSGVPLSSVLTFTFQQTRFVAVTAYQNSKVQLHLPATDRYDFWRTSNVLDAAIAIAIPSVCLSVRLHATLAFFT